MRPLLGLALFATTALAAADPDADTPPPALVGPVDQAECGFTASSGFDDEPVRKAFDLRSMAQDAALYFPEMAAAVHDTGKDAPKSDEVAQAMEDELNRPAHHRRNYWRRRRARLFDQRRLLADATGRIFSLCGKVPVKALDLEAACEKLVADRRTMERTLTPETTPPAKIEVLEAETRAVAEATKRAVDLLEAGAGAPFFALEKELLKEFDKMEVVAKARGAIEGRKSDVQDKLANAEAELYRLEDEVNRNTEAQEDALEAQIEELRAQLKRLADGDDVNLEMAFLPAGWRDSVELRSVKADKKVKAFVAKHGARYRAERAKYRFVAEQLDGEEAKLERILKSDPAASGVGPRLATALLERGEQLPVAVSYVLEATPGHPEKPSLVSTSLLCGKRKEHPEKAFLVSVAPPRPPAPPPPPAAPREKRAVAAAKPPKSAKAPPPEGKHNARVVWPPPSLQMVAARRAGLEEPIECNTWTLYCERPVPAEPAEAAPSQAPSP